MKNLSGICLIIAFLTSLSAASFASVDTKNVSSYLYQAMDKYKQKNYVGCVQDTKRLIDNGKSSDLAYYYQAIAYAQLGMKTEAKEAYEKTVELSKNQAIINYANQGLQCINNPSSCDDSQLDEKDISTFIKSGKFLHSDVEEALQKQASDRVKADINGGRQLDERELKYLNFNDTTSPLEPTDKEIADAVRTFQKLGMNPLSGYSSYMPMMSQNADNNLLQMSAFLNQGSNNNNNNMMNIIPFLASMQKQGGNPNMGKEMVQAMLYNQMLPNLNFSSNEL